MLKKQLIVLIAAILLTPLMIVQAATNDRPDLCGDLPQADCQILIDNEAVMDSVDSFAFVMDMTLDVSGAEAMQLAGQGGGALSLGDEFLQAAKEMGETMADADIGALAEFLLTSLEADIWFDLQGVSGEEDFDMELKLLLKDGIVLIGADTLAALTGQPVTGMDALGIDLNGAFGDMFEETGASPETDASDMEAAEATALTVTRLPDSEVNGVAVAVFEMGIDVESYFSLVSSEDLAAASTELEDAEAAQALMESIAVKEFYARQYIGLEDHYTYGMDVALDMTMASQSAEAESDASWIVDMSLEMSDFNEPVEVEIPSDVFVFPLTMMTQMSSQSQ